MKKKILLSALIILIAGMPYSTFARSGDQNTGLEEGLKGSTILMIVGDDNETAEPGQGTGDVFIRNHLEKVLGHQVILGIDADPSDELYVSAVGADLVIISESTTSHKMKDKLTTVITPIINYEAFLQDEFGCTAPGPPTDPGEPEGFAYGARNKDTEIKIVKPEHPLAAGLNGNVKVYKEPRQVTWGKVGKGATVVATLSDKESAAVIYVYEQGSKLFDGTTAAGMRIGFFLEEENITGTSNFMTEEGLRLFNAAVKFALESEIE